MSASMSKEEPTVKTSNISATPGPSKPVHSGSAMQARFGHIVQANTGQIMPQQKQLEDANKKLTEEQNLIRQ